MTPLEWRWLHAWSSPVRQLTAALLLALMLMAAAMWLIWQPQYAQQESVARTETRMESSGLPSLHRAGDPSEEVVPSLDRDDSVESRRMDWFASSLLIGVFLILGVAWSGMRKHLSVYSLERRKVMQAISATEKINLAIFSALPDTMYLMDRDGAFLDFRGHDPDKLDASDPIVGHTAHEVFPADIAERIVKALRRSIDGNEMQTLEYSLIESGRIAQYEARIAACGGDRALAIVRDITDRDQAERTIREAESKFRILVEQSLTGIYVVQDGRFVYVNPRFAEVFGYTPQEILDTENIAELVVPDDRAAVRMRLSDALVGEGEGSHYAIRGIRKDSTVLHAEIYRSVIEYNGKPAIIGTLLDVTEQRETQEQLRVLGMAVEQSAEGVLVIDTTGLVCFVNPAWARMHGYSVQEVTGRHFRIFHTEEQLRKEVFPVINRFEKTSIYRAEMGHKRKDGSTFMSSTAFASLRDDDGRVIGAVGICRDITEQKNYEAELLAAKEHAEELSRVKTAFLTNMSHEIRTPLTGILGFAKILEEELPSAQREFAHMIQISGDRLMNTLNSILDLARLEAGEITLIPRDVNLAQEVRDAATVFQAVALEKNLEFDLCLPAERLPARVDRNTLNIILNNLIGNAVKFTDHGKIGISLEADEDRVALAVTDTGVGIEDKFIPHLFDEFKQESDGLTRSHEGSGLGLAITKRLIHLMDGEISVESVKGSGSRFVVTFPRFIDRPAYSNVA